MDEEIKKDASAAVAQQASDAFSLLKTVLVTLVVMFFITHCIIANAIVPTGSMEKTIEPGDRIIGIRLLKNYGRGDIVIFKDPENQSRYLIKRIIGTPGDRLTIRRDIGSECCSVYINGVKLKEEYLPEPMLSCPEFDNLDIEIPQNSYFCMGDNRNNSKDARFWERKLITGDEIIAKAAVCYWPLSDAGAFEKPEY